MLGRQRFSKIFHLFAMTVLISAFFWGTVIGISDKRLCADENCKTIISLGVGLLHYTPGAKGMVSFKKGDNIRIMSKHAGSDPSVWGIEVNGRQGYAPSNCILEQKVLFKTENLVLVDVVLPESQKPELENAHVLKGSKNVIEPTTTVPLENSKPSDIVVNSSKEDQSEEQTPASKIRDIKGTVADFTHIVDSYSLNGQRSDDNVSDLKATEKLSVTAIPQSLEVTIADEGTLNNSGDAINKDRLTTASLVQTETVEMGTTILPELNESLATNDQQMQNENEDVGNGGNGKKEHAGKDGFNSRERGNVKASPLNQSVDNNNATNYKNNEQINSSMELSSVVQNQQYTSTSINTQTSTPLMPLEASTTGHYSNEQLHAEKSVKESESTYSSIFNATSMSPPEMMSPLAKAEGAKEAALKNTKVDEDQNVTLHSSTQDTIGTDPNLKDKAKANASYLASNTVEETNIKYNQSSQDKVPNVNHVAHIADSQPIPVEDNVINPNKPSDNPVSGTKEETTNKVIDATAMPFNDTEISSVNNTSAQETVNGVPSTAVEGGETSYLNSNVTSSTDPKAATETHLPTPTVEETISQNDQSLKPSLPDYETGFYHLNDKMQEAGSAAISTGHNDVNSNKPSDNMVSETNQQHETINKKTTDFVPNEQYSTQQLEDITKVKKKENRYQELYTPQEASLDSQSQISKEDLLNKPEHHQIEEHQNIIQNNPEFSYMKSTSTHIENNNYEDGFGETTEKPHYINTEQFPKENDSPNQEQASTSTNSVQQTTFDHGFVDHIEQEDNSQKLTSSGQPIKENNDVEKKENRGLFATVMETVNNMLPNNKKHKKVDYNSDDSNNELDRILFLNSDSAPPAKDRADEMLFCEKLDQNNCPSPLNSRLSGDKCECSWKTLFINEFSLESFLQALASKILELGELIAFLVIVACTSLFFIFGYYCFCKSSSEGALLSKLNQLESSLLASHKENAILKQNLLCTKQKLSSIEDNSFGTNDMVVSLKKELEEELLEKARMQEQIVTLQKELENAADAGIELNKIVSELLSNQTGDESIISSVEELQRQLNEQQNTILEINASLAEKSRENSELQLMLAEQNSRFETQLSDLQLDNDELEAEKGNLRSRLEEIRADFNKDITAALESKNFEIKRLQNETVQLNDKVEAEHAKWQTCMAKVEALEDCLKGVKRSPSVNISQLIDVAHIKADLLDTQKKYNALKERMELELDARKLAESQLQSSTAEIEKIKQDFNQTEKDKLEAQTRLEVLSNYFKEKENQLQKELSLKEAMRLKQQGETTTTVDRLTTMQEEIQSLKSQNDALRAEIEAQVAAHKAQTGTLENRAHETWLAARQSDRRFEEARAEATALRRKLTALAGGTINEIHKSNAGPAGIGDDLTNAPSPILMETTGSPILGRMPPPPFLPPPFMGPPPPFMGMPPPPPFVPPGEIRPAPLGRILSPPPPQRSGHLDFDDYLDYEGSGPWHRHHTYSPPPRTYRSLSPTDSRYNYGDERDLISTYDTETDYSPPPSPRGSRRRERGSGSEKEDYKFRHPYNNSNKSLPGNKDAISSGSDNSSFQAGKTLKSSGGKFLI